MTNTPQNLYLSNEADEAIHPGLGHVHLSVNHIINQREDVHLCVNHIVNGKN